MTTYQESNKSLRFALDRVLNAKLQPIEVKKINIGIDSMLELAYMKGKTEALQEVLNNVKKVK